MICLIQYWYYQRHEKEWGWEKSRLKCEDCYYKEWCWKGKEDASTVKKC